MKNPYLNINRIVFLVTLLCSGKCKHCSVAGRSNETGCRFAAPARAIETIQSLADTFNIHSFMIFGGEPLIYPDITCQIHKTALQFKISERQIITNGYFSKKPDRIKQVALSVRDSGINDVWISVDAFHHDPYHNQMMKPLELLTAGPLSYKTGVFPKLPR